MRVTKLGQPKRKISAAFLASSLSHPHFIESIAHSAAATPHDNRYGGAIGQAENQCSKWWNVAAGVCEDVKRARLPPIAATEQDERAK